MLLLFYLHRVLKLNKENTGNIGNIHHKVKQQMIPGFMYSIKVRVPVLHNVPYTPKWTK